MRHVADERPLLYIYTYTYIQLHQRVIGRVRRTLPGNDGISASTPLEDAFGELREPEGGRE